MMAARHSSKIDSKTSPRRNPRRNCRVPAKPAGLYKPTSPHDPLNKRKKTKKPKRFNKVDLGKRLFKAAAARLKRKVAGELKSQDSIYPPAAQEIASMNHYYFGEPVVRGQHPIPGINNTSQSRTWVVLRNRTVEEDETGKWAVGEWVEKKPLKLSLNALKTLEDRKVEVFRNWRRQNTMHGMATKNNLRLWVLECAAEGKLCDPALKKWVDFDDVDKGTRDDKSDYPHFPPPYRYFPSQHYQPRKILKGYVKVSRKGLLRVRYRRKEKTKTAG
jgi:hypothetical protein